MPFRTIQNAVRLHDSTTNTPWKTRKHRSCISQNSSEIRLAAAFPLRVEWSAEKRAPSSRSSCRRVLVFGSLPARRGPRNDSRFASRSNSMPAALPSLARCNHRKLSKAVDEVQIFRFKVGQRVEANHLRGVGKSQVGRAIVWAGCHSPRAASFSQNVGNVRPNGDTTPTR